MTLAALALAGSALVTLILAVLAGRFLRDPAAGMALATHRAAELPRVMGGRYAGLTLLGAAATVYRDMGVIAVLFAVFSGLALYDSWVYGQSGQPYSKHLIAGIVTALVAVVALAAIFKSGAGA